MRLLLDAHALLWWLADDPSLDRNARDLIADPTNEVIVSAVTVWEIAIKRAIGKLSAPDGLAAVLERSGFIEAPVTAADAERAGGLEAIHRDPFDRMLVAQAVRLRAVVVTRDPVFVRYGTETVWTSSEP
jgi:PIN domain nuclease of toxin-antitoxin system